MARFCDEEELKQSLKGRGEDLFVSIANDGKRSFQAQGFLQVRQVRACRRARGGDIGKGFVGELNGWRRTAGSSSGWC